MEITSFTFFVLVGASLLIYWRLPARHQWKLLLADSLIFYFANATWYTFAYVIVSVVSVYGAARYFARQIDGKVKKRVLALTVLVNAGILVVLKYTNFAIHTFNFLGEHILHIQGVSDVAWLAPLAISFYMLQLLSYLLDCYWGVAEPYDNVLHLALYTIYFPLMTSGPICRFDDIGRALFEERRFDYDRVRSGLIRIAWGFFKKLAISNRAAVIVDGLWASHETSQGVCVWIAVAFFVVQLYTDFSGIMDIALGVSSCFGITLPENFRSPFYSRSVQEFWRRWHITLGTWLRDYIMNPLLRSGPFIRLGAECKKRFGKKAGRRVPVYLGMLVLWLTTGLWHEGSWRFIVGMGCWFWFVIVCGQLLEPLFKRMKSCLRIREQSWWWHAFQSMRTIALWMVSLLFFRAASLQDALTRLAASLRVQMDAGFLWEINLAVPFADLGGIGGLILMTLCFLAVLGVDYLRYRGVDVQKKLAGLNAPCRWAIYYAIVLVVFCSLSIANQESLYAQF